MQYVVRIIRTAEQLDALKFLEHDRLVADVETFGTDPKNGKLLGIAFAPLEGKFADGSDAAYVVINEYLYKTSQWSTEKGIIGEADFSTALSAELIGFNYCYDRGWLDHFFSIRTKWHADARLMWHMSEPADRTRSYGLKDAQVEVLKWPARGDAALEEMVKARGGSLKKGDHYLADTDRLGCYAGLDVISTALLYKARKPFFDEHQQWGLLEKMMQYSALLQLNSDVGVNTNTAKLAATVERLKEELDAARKWFVHEAYPYVKKLVHTMRDHRAAKYSTDSSRHVYLSTPSMWQKFNLSSDKQKRELFYEIMGLPKVQMVKPRKDKKTGRKIYSKNAATGFDAFVAAVGASGRQDLQGAVEQYRRAEEAEAILKGFAAPLLATVRNGRVHPRFNPCGTKSYRLSGYKPSFMNLPFDDAPFMSCFSVDEGYIGIAMDLAAIEPTCTTHYSQDPHLLKVFRDGLGDVYLNLALTLFPLEESTRYGEEIQAHILNLHMEYNPNAPITGEIKARHKLLRDKVAKTIQLAVQYTGTEYTVSLNLTQKGFPTTLEQGAVLVHNYKKHYASVEVMNQKLARLHARKGYLRNAIGRVVRKSRSEDKDLPNLFFQSSGHDILTLFILKLYEICQERGIKIKPVIIDLHDATANMCPIEQKEMLRQAYLDALAFVNIQIKLSVPIKAEMKEFFTLAGLKGKDESAKLKEEGQGL